MLHALLLHHVSFTQARSSADNSAYYRNWLNDKQTNDMLVAKSVGRQSWLATVT